LTRYQAETAFHCCAKKKIYRKENNH